MTPQVKKGRRRKKAAGDHKSMQRYTLKRCSIAAFWCGAGTIGCGVVAMATLNPVLFQVYLVTTIVTFVGVIALRCWSGSPLDRWAMWAWTMPTTFLALSIVLFVPACGLINNADLRKQSADSLKQIALGIAQFQEKNGHLPAAATFDAHGT